MEKPVSKEKGICEMYDTDKTFLLRMPRVLHGDLKEKARSTGVSLHEYILRVLNKDIKVPSR